MKNEKGVNLDSTYGEFFQSAREFFQFIDDNGKEKDFRLIEKKLQNTVKQNSDLFDQHKENAAFEAIQKNKIEWDAQYYSQQKLSLQRNFSYERAMHLIEVYLFLAQNKHTGFSLGQATTKLPVNRDSNRYMNFTPSQSLASALQSGSTNRIRAALMAELESNRHNKQSMQEIIAWTEKQYPNLFTSYEENNFEYPIDRDTDSWDKNYFSKQFISIETNFSKDRFDHLLDVFEYLRTQNTTGFQHQSKQSQANNTQLSKKKQNPDKKGRGSSQLSLRKIAMLVGAVIVMILLIFALLEYK